MHTVIMVFWTVFSAAMLSRFYWLKRTGRWKRPRTYPWAMTLMALAMTCGVLALVLNRFGR